MLGGRAAEEVVFQDTSTGAQDDFQRASELARRRMTAFGMSELLGPYAVEHERQSQFLEGYEPAAHGYSQVTAQRIDREAQATIEHMYQRARHMLEEHRDLLETVPQYLLQHEVIDQPTLAMLTSELRLSTPLVLAAPAAPRRTDC